MDLNTYYDRVRQLKKDDPSLRLGQAHMVVLSIAKPYLYALVRGTDVDPFYNDSKLPRFRRKLELTWSDNNGTKSEDKPEEITINLNLSWPFL